MTDKFKQISHHNFIAQSLPVQQATAVVPIVLLPW